MQPKKQPGQRIACKAWLKVLWCLAFRFDSMFLPWMQSIPASFDSPVAAHDEFVCTRGSKHFSKNTQTYHGDIGTTVIIGAAAILTKRSLASMACERAMLCLPVSNQKSCLLTTWLYLIHKSIIGFQGGRSQNWLSAFSNRSSWVQFYHYSIYFRFPPMSPFPVSSRSSWMRSPSLVKKRTCHSMSIQQYPPLVTTVGLMLQATGDKLCHTNFAASD